MKAETKGKIMEEKVEEQVESLSLQTNEGDDIELPEVEEEVDVLDGVSAEAIEEVIRRYEAHKAARANLDAEEEDRETVVRQLKPVPDKRYGLVIIKREGGGKVPKILQGHWLNMDEAEHKIDLYSKGLLSPTPKEMTNITVKAVNN